MNPQDPMYREQWNLAMMNVPGAWEHTLGEGAVVGIIDSGIDYSHQDLGCEEDIQIMDYDSLETVKRKCQLVWESINRGTHAKILPGWNFLTHIDFSWDRFRHGTYMAGVIAADADDLGIIGVAPSCKIRPYVVIDEDGRGSQGTLVAAITRAVDDGCDVISMSLGWSRTHHAVNEVIGEAVKAGVLLIASTGNSNRKISQYPAAYEGVLAVGACRKDGNRWVYSDTRGSNYGDPLMVVCPGARQPTTWKMRSRYTMVDATSAAAANMAGVAALVKSVNKGINWQTFLEIIHRSSDRSEWDEHVGWGVPDAAKLVKMALEMKDPGKNAEMIKFLERQMATLDGVKTALRGCVLKLEEENVSESV
jgi:subtilisin family serine protease